jgi:excisionase family DNA binding protein
MVENLVLTVAEGAERLGKVSIKLVYKLFDRGEFEGYRVGSCIRIFPESIDAYIAAHRNVKPADKPAPVPKPAPKRRRQKREKHAYRFLPIDETSPTAAAN